MLFCAVSAFTQDGRPVTSAWTVEGGTSHLADTYLTPLHYDGWNVALAYERWQAMRFNPEDWVMRLELAGQLAKTHNRVDNADMWDLDVTASWSVIRRWPVAVAGQHLTLAAGPMAMLEGGCLYLSRNGNNPVSVKAACSVGVTGAAFWHTRLVRRPLTLRWQPSMPLVGVFFSPDYGELYYEIYLGNHSGLAHFAWPASRFQLENLVTADWRIGATALRVGYRGQILTTCVNNITTRRFTHMFVLGISGEFLSITPGKTISSRNISAYY